jgi:hypothetical protein
VLKTILQFFALGALLFAGRFAVARYSEPNTIPLTVEVSPDLGKGQIEEAIKNEILIDQSVRMGWHETDPIVRQHMLRNMKFVDREDNAQMTDLELIEEAVEIGMPKSDAIIRARLIQRAELALEAVYESQKPTDQDLSRYLAAHKDDFMRDARYVYAHVFLSRDKRGDSLLDEANALKAKLSSQPDLSPADASRMGDPLLRARAQESRTAEIAAAAYGQPFADAMTIAEVGQWVGPIESVFGAHLIRLIERTEASVPPIEEIDNQVRGRLLRELRDANFKERYAKLRAYYEIKVVETK